MLAAIVYSIGCFVAAAILTTFWVLTRPIQSRDEMRSWRVLLGLFVFCFGAPYGYNELLTRIYGPEMDKAVQSAYKDVPIGGPLRYYRVTSVTGDKAKVLVIAEEKQDWGGTDHPMISLTLAKKGNTWRTTSYRILNSERLNREAYVFPVYW